MEYTGIFQGGIHPDRVLFLLWMLGLAELSRPLQSPVWEKTLAGSELPLPQSSARAPTVCLLRMLLLESRVHDFNRSCFHKSGVIYWFIIVARSRDENHPLDRVASAQNSVADRRRSAAQQVWEVLVLPTWNLTPRERHLLCPRPPPFCSVPKGLTVLPTLYERNQAAVTPLRWVYTFLNSAMPNISPWKMSLLLSLICLIDCNQPRTRQPYHILISMRRWLFRISHFFGYFWYDQAAGDNKPKLPSPGGFYGLMRSSWISWEGQSWPWSKEAWF